MYSRHEWAIMRDADGEGDEAGGATEDDDNETLTMSSSSLPPRNANGTDARWEGDADDDVAVASDGRGGRGLQRVAKKRGGLFNTYQTSPLHQGYGTHYATIWVGTPSQRKSVIVDTGSHFTAFPCRGCDDCGEEHHTDRYFDPEASSTFRALQCGSCLAGKCDDDKCVFSQAYTEGSSWSAYESVDKVFVGGRELSTALNPANNAFKTDFLFGCQVKETG
jgi:hypothetical protein